MLSGNGRHRRPRQAPALLVAAGVTGSAIAIPLLGATGASAADGTAWDRVAECETGGSWSQNTGNGYYGGLQLTQGDWEAYGGLDFAASADRASRSQQIAVAERLLDDKGPDAWPTCGLLGGLADDTGDADVDTGVSESPDPGGILGGITGGTSDDTSDEPDTAPSSSSAPPEEATDSPGRSDAPDGDGDSGASDGTAETTPRDDSDKSGQSGDASADAEAGGSGGAGTGRHRGPGAEGADGSAGGGRADGSPGRHASRDAAAARDAVDGTYTVRTGDSLWVIADSLDLEGGWHGLYTANREEVGDDPDLILPGQQLAVQGESVEK